MNFNIFFKCVFLKNPLKIELFLPRVNQGVSHSLLNLPWLINPAPVTPDISVNTSETTDFLNKMK